MVKINDAVSLGISAETSEFKRHLRQVNALLRSVKDPTESLNTSLKLLKAGFDANEYGAQQFGDAIAKAAVKATKQVDAVKKLRAEYEKLQGASRAAAAAVNREKGLAVQADIQAEQQRVAAARAALQKRLDDARSSASRQSRVGPGAADLEYGQQLSERARQANMAAAATATLNRNRAMGLAIQRQLLELDRQREAGLAALAAREERLQNIRRSAARQANVGPNRGDFEHGQQLAEEARQAEAAAAATARLNRNRAMGLAIQRQLQELDRQREAGDAARAAREERLAEMRRSAARQANVGPNRGDLEHGQQLGEQRRNAGAGYMQQFETLQERVGRQLQEARQLFDNGSLSAQQYGRAVGQINRQLSLSAQLMTGFRTAITTVLGPLVVLYTGFTAFKNSITLGADLEQSRAKLKIFTGSLQEAEKTLSRLRALSVQGVSFAGGQRAVTTMLQFGVVQKDLLPSFRAIAEITAGDTERMENLALAFSQSAAAGRLMGQELLQMVNAGFNPLKVISDQTGKSLADLKADMSNGLISFEMVKKAFIDATSEGGKFNGLLEEIAETTSGKLSQSVSRMQELGIAFSTLIKPATDGTLDAFNKALAETAQLLDQMGGSGLPEPGKPERIKHSGFVEDWNRRQDNARAREALGKGDAENAVRALDRNKKRNAPGLVAGFDSLSEEELRLGEEFRKALTETEELQEKVRQGKTVTAAEQSYLDFLAKETRQIKESNQAKVAIAKDVYEAEIKANKSRDARKQSYVEYVEKIGQGHFSDAQITTFKQYKIDLEAAATAAKKLETLTDRIREAHEKPMRKAKDSINDLAYGKDYNEYLTQVGAGLNDKDRATWQKKIDVMGTGQSGVDYIKGNMTHAKYRPVDIDSDDFMAAHKAAEEMLATKLKLKKLTDEASAKEDATKKEADRALKVTDELGELRKKIKLQADLLVMTKEEARVRELMHGGHTKAEAQTQAKAEKELKTAENMANLRERAVEVERSGDKNESFIAGMAELELLKSKGGLSGAGFDAARDKLLTENIKTEKASASPTINKGSQEAFKALTGQTVDKVNMQLTEAKKQTLLATTAAQVRQRQKELLEELNDNKPARMGP